MKLKCKKFLLREIWWEHFTERTLRNPNEGVLTVELECSSIENSYQTIARRWCADKSEEI